MVKENKKNKREHRGTSQRLFESYKKRKNSLSSSVFHLLLRERKKERKRHTHTLARATTTRVKYKRKREETERQNKKKERERETSHLSRRTSELVSQQEHRLVGHFVFFSILLLLLKLFFYGRESERIFSAFANSPFRLLFMRA